MMEIRWRPSNYDLRVFAGLQLLFCAIVAALLWRRHALTEAAVSLTAVSAGLALVGIVAPQRIRLIYVGWMLAVFPIGWGVSHVVLAIVYFGVLWPIGGILRLRGWDPLQRRQDAAANSYWQERSPPPEPSRYFRQF